MINSNHGRVLEQLIVKRKQEIVDAITEQAMPRKTYLLFVGMVQGLTEALQLSQAADQQLNGD